MVINMTNVVVLIGVIQKAYYDKQKDSYFVDLKLEKTIKNEAGTIEFETYKVKLWKGCYHDISSLSSFKPYFRCKGSFRKRWRRSLCCC